MLTRLTVLSCFEKAANAHEKFRHKYHTDAMAVVELEALGSHTLP